MNRSNRIIIKEKHTSGGGSGTVTDVKRILKRALENMAEGMILVHNHPSYNVNPSESDIKVTQKVKEAAKIMDIHLMDHIIIAGKKFYSFADEGLI